MDLTCDKCGHKAPRVEFRFLSHASSAGAVVYRLCPACKAPVVCDDTEFAEDYASGRTWGTGSLRGRAFTRKNPPPKAGEGEGRS